MKKLHYGWVICGACTLLMVCTMGLCSNVFSIYLPYMEREGLTGAESSALLSVRCLFSLLSMLLVTQYYRKLHLRAGVGVACLLAGISCLINYFADSALLYGVGAAAGGVAYGLGSMIPVSILIERWFFRRKGLALGICASGSGIASVCFPPVLTALVERFGLKTAFFWEAAFVLLSGVLIFLLLRNTPEELHLKPLGASGQSGERTAVRSRGGQSLRPLSAAAMACALLLIGGVSSAASGHFSVLLMTSGCGAQTAALCFSLFGVALTLGKFLFGAAADRMGAKRASALFYLVLTAGCLLSLALRGGQVWVCVTLALLLGLGFPPSTVGVSLWAADFSDEAHYARTLKWFQICYVLGGMALSALPGWLYDRTGEYRSSYALFALGTALGVALLLLVYRRAAAAKAAETAAEASQNAKVA